MRICQVVGTVTLNRCHASFDGASFRLVAPLSLSDLSSHAEPSADEFVVFDPLGAGHGQRIAVSEGAEAAQPFRPDVKPVDAYNAAILDHIDID